VGGRAFVVALGVAVPWLLTLPFGGGEVVSRNLGVFAYVTRFNDLLWWQTERYVWIDLDQKNGYYTVILLVITLVISLALHRDWRRATLWTLGAVLILSPALHPWYVTWILPIACWRKNISWFVLSLSVAICLLVWQPGPFWSAWKMTPALHWLVIGPPLAALAVSFGLRASRFGFSRASAEPNSDRPLPARTPKP